MKKSTNHQNGKKSLVNCMNVCALACASYTVNVACGWLHHQPVVPQDAKRLRKF